MNRKGKIEVGCIFLVIVTVALVYGGVKFGVPYSNYYQLRRSIEGVVNAEAARPKHTAHDIAQFIIDEAAEHSIHLTFEHVEVWIDEFTLSVDVAWSVPVVLPGSTRVLDFEVKKQRNVLR